MPLHPEIQKIVRSIPSADGSRPDPAAVRADEEARVPPHEQRLPIRDVQARTIPTRGGEVGVRIYTAADQEDYGLLIHFHGGAFFSGSLETYDQVGRALAQETGYRVITVGYRLAPENAFPAGLQDCCDAVRWAAEHGAELHWDGRNLAVSGDSSGGNFAAAVTAKTHDEGFDAISHQVLYYPSVDLDFDEARYPSLTENARGYGLETAGLKPFNGHYIDSGADPSDPRVSPIKRPDLSGLPKALILTAQYDPLRDEGEAYGQRLAEAGVQTQVHRYESANHGFLVNFGWIPEMYEAFRETGRFLARQ